MLLLTVHPLLCGGPSCVMYICILMCLCPSIWTTSWCTTSRSFQSCATSAKCSTNGSCTSRTRLLETVCIKANLVKVIIIHNRWLNFLLLVSFFSVVRTLFSIYRTGNTIPQFGTNGELPRRGSCREEHYAILWSVFRGGRDKYCGVCR